MIELWLPVSFIVAGFLCCLFWPSQPRPSVSVSVRMWLFPLAAVIVAAGGLLLCFFIAATVHRDNTTNTHCGVFNFWPSVSSAIGNNHPELFIWRLAVSLHNVMVMFDSFLFLSRFPQSSRTSIVITRIWAFCKALSCAGLYLLTFLSSTENFLLHEIGFLSWVVFGGTAMILLAFQLYPSSVRLVTAKELYAWKWIRNCLVVYLVSLCGCGIT